MTNEGEDDRREKNKVESRAHQDQKAAVQKGIMEICEHRANEGQCKMKSEDWTLTI